MSKLYKQILDEYHNNRHCYDKLTKEIYKNIDGRVPHDRVAVLNILVKLFDIKSYLEIGVHNGASMSYVVNQNHKKLECYGIDLFCQNKAYTLYDPDNLNIDRSSKNIKNNNTSDSVVTLIAGNSTSQAVWNQVKDIQVDLLFLDGDHNFPGVEKDFYNYSRLVRKGGFIVLDDCEPNYPAIIKLSEKITASDSFDVLGNFEDCDFIIQVK